MTALLQTLRTASRGPCDAVHHGATLPAQRLREAITFVILRC